ncbi:four-domain proteases inhibitor-like [Ylistrum balloti]|uniref:four-domain proteases inhibitor-like n=1 Tax=Ylistrum balloti TaxID=509963 RepID=UPI002905D872|nr:four-domain proteases inhibitor-like [Ylistrum balloti]
MFGPFLLMFVAVSAFTFDELQTRSGWYCMTIRHRACYPYGEHLMCGTDNYTYYNKCEFTKSHCLNNQIHVAHDGSCNGESHLSSNLTAGEILLLHFMCEDMGTHRCAEDYDPVCGSNGVTYMNECEYEQVRCMHNSLTIASRGPCAPLLVG